MEESYYFLSNVQKSQKSLSCTTLGIRYSKPSNFLLRFGQRSAASLSDLRKFDLRVSHSHTKQMRFPADTFKRLK